MPRSIFQLLTHSLNTLSLVACDLFHLVVLVFRSRCAMATENLFLRKQLALFQERKVKPHRAHDFTRLIMVILGRMFSWRGALVNVQPIPSSAGTARDSVSSGAANPGRLADLACPKTCGDSPKRWPPHRTWAEERIANELKLKLTIQVSPRIIGKYLNRDSPVRTPDPKQHWLTIVHNHIKVMVACDFFLVITAAFRTLYVFVVMEIGSRRILHHNSHGVSHGVMDAAAVPGSGAERSSLPLRHP